MTILKYIIFFFLFLLVSSIQAQDPASFIIGKEEFKNKEIFSIVETSDQRLYIATNNGLYAYTQGIFKVLNTKTDKAKTSLFGLVKNKKDEVFCYSLAGEIFQIEGNTVKLILSIPTKYVTNRIELLVNKQGHLIYFSKGYCLKIESTGEYKVLHKDQSNEKWGWQISKLLDGRLLTSTDSVGKYYEIIGENIRTHYYPNKLKKIEHTWVRSFFTLKNKLVSTSKGVFNLANSNHTLTLPNLYKNRFFSLDTNEVWGLKNKNGISVFQLVEGNIKVTKTLFKNHFISASAKSKSGAIYLGTFREGIIVIPNLKMKTHSITTSSGKIHDITVSTDNKVFFSEMGKGVKRYDKNISLITPEKKEHFGRIFWFNNANFNINKIHKELYHTNYDLSIEAITIPTTHAICKVDSNTYLFATSKGIVKKGKGFAHLNWQKTETNIGYPIYSLINSGVRTYAIAVDKKNKILYYSSLKKTIGVLPNGKIKPVLFEGKEIICNDLHFYDGKLWCATHQGVLVYKNFNLIAQYTFSKTEIPCIAKQLQIENETLYVRTEKRIRLVHLPSGKINSLGVLDGLHGAINKFSISDDKLWFLMNNEKLLSINKVDINSKKHSLHIYIDSIFIADKKVNFMDKQIFSFDHNSFEAFVDYRNISLDTRANIHYRIKGLEEKWNKNKHPKDKIIYQYLPPGKYTFEVFANHPVLQSSIKSYSFEITPPYWLEWWFFALLFLLFTGIMFLIFRFRLEKNKKKEAEKLEKERLKNELIEAELRALRSQMNPHFIFNSLNSIQALILNEEKESSYDYIVLFSKLVRNILTYSNKEYILADAELDFLTTYLKLQKLRFGESFNYTIDYHGDQEVFVAALIVQPFVENALIHGLQHRNKNKKISIEFRLEDTLICTIIDNGIGRKASQKIKERQNRKHQSFALEAIKKRLQMYESNTENKYNFTITDLYENGIPSGTKVEVFIPFYYRF